MRVYLNRSIVDGPWGGGNRWLRAVTAELTARGHTVSSLDDADVAVACGMDRSGEHPSADELALLAGRPLVFRANDCDSRKGTYGIDERARAVARGAAAVVCVSRWLRAELGLSDALVIVNGVDSSFCGSPVPHREKPLIVTHHWSDNPLKGADWYAELDSLAADGAIDFKFVGRPCTVLPHTLVVPPLDAPKLACEIASADAYITGTVNDPGPNHVLEAIACGLPIVVKSTGGGAVEFAGDACAADPTCLRSIVEARLWRRSETIVPTWSSSAGAFVDVIEGAAR